MAFCKVESIMEPNTSVKGKGFSLGLPIINKKAPTYKLNLTTEQKQALVAFLKTLTDNESLSN